MNATEALPCPDGYFCLDGTAIPHCKKGGKQGLVLREIRGRALESLCARARETQERLERVVKREVKKGPIDT